MGNKIKINDIFAYIIGNYRHWCYENFRLLLRKHIIEQYEWRLSVMNKECYSSGSCIKCGCDTPALQMANKACKGGCYFNMKGKREWKSFKEVFETREEIKEYVPPTLMHPTALPTDCYQIGKDCKTFEIKLDKKWKPTSEIGYIMGTDPYKKEEET